MINFGTQYYRAPFPLEKYWKDDMRRMKESGLNCVQLWVLWSWVESKPGEFVYDDYDRLVETARESGLNVVLSVIAELQPLWINREAPGSELVNHLGHKIISDNRSECHQGLTPGGCIDHPEVWSRMAKFIATTVERYKGIPNLAGWDIWNELRWNVQADGLVCHCEHTLKSFREWLSLKYGGLDGLNKAWIRRYSCWEDVRPGKLPDRPYTEMMAFLKFLTWRSNRHALERYKIVKGLDPAHIATAHGPCPSHTLAGWEQDQALNRGNDWGYADDLDGIGCSNFPAWGNLNVTEYSVLMESTRSAARGKKFWISELQGGRSNVGFNLHNHVEAAQQQRWVWNAVAAKADTVLFWCWRNEIFGRESSGFGITGDDGFAASRLDFIGRTGRIFKENEAALESWRPEEARTGILFSPDTYGLYWSQEARAAKPMEAIRGWAKACVERSMPFELVEEAHLEALDKLKLLIMPKTSALDDEKAARIIEFVEKGGTLLCECETGAWDSRGLFRYPEERFLAKATGLHEGGRRAVPADGLKVKYAGRTFKLKARQWTSPWTDGKEGDGSLFLSVARGKGRIILCGAFLGEAYDAERNIDFEELLLEIAKEAGAYEPSFEILSPNGEASKFGTRPFVKCGASQGRPMLFAFLPPGSVKGASLRFEKGFWPTKKLKDILSGKEIPLSASRGGAQTLKLKPGDWNMAVLIPY